MTFLSLLLDVQFPGVRVRSAIPAEYSSEGSEDVAAILVSRYFVSIDRKYFPTGKVTEVLCQSRPVIVVIYWRIYICIKNVASK